MKKKLLKFSALALALGLSLSACDEKEEETVVTKDTYSVEVIDIDGEVLLEKSFEKTENTVLDDLNASTTVTGSNSSFGFTIESIANSVVDKNYYVAIYENGEYASTGVDGLVVDNGDKFKFQVECFNTISSGYGTMDETDILVDKIIYSYAKNQMKDYLKNTGSYTALGGFSNVAFGAADYWSFIGLNLMIQNKYDSNLFNINNVPANVKTDLEAFDTTTLSGAQFGKYYYAAKALGVDLTNGFKTAYQSYLNNLPEDYGMYSEYEYPFTLGISKNLNVTSTNLEKVIKTAYRADTTYGIDGLAWQVASLAQLTTLSTDELNAFEAKDYGNSISTALALLPFAALNVSPRAEVYQKDGKDLVEILIENYYDSENKIIKYNSEEATNSNTPQIYAALMAYKAQRDSGKAAYIFA